MEEYTERGQDIQKELVWKEKQSNNVQPTFGHEQNKNGFTAFASSNIRDWRCMAYCYLYILSNAKYFTVLQFCILK